QLTQSEMGRSESTRLIAFDANVLARFASHSLRAGHATSARLQELQNAQSCRTLATGLWRWFGATSWMAVHAARILPLNRFITMKSRSASPGGNPAFSVVVPKPPGALKQSPPDSNADFVQALSPIFCGFPGDHLMKFDKLRYLIQKRRALAATFPWDGVS